MGAAIELVESSEATAKTEAATVLLFFLNIAILRLLIVE
jgi:hypothetical protein